MLYARIDDGVMFELFTPPESVLITDCFTAELAAMFVAVPDGSSVEHGWTYDGTNFAAPVMPPPPPPTPDEVLAEKIAAGITITSTGNPDLNATYALDGVSTGQIYQLGLFASQFDTFPGGATQPYPDATGVPHVFTVAQFVAFLRVVAPLVSALTTQAQVLAHGGSPIWPAQSATIV